MKTLAALAATAGAFVVQKNDHVSVTSLEKTVTESAAFQKAVQNALPEFCGAHPSEKCTAFLQDALFCLNFANKMEKMTKMDGYKEITEHCKNVDKQAPASLLAMPPIPGDMEAFLQAPPHKPAHVKR